MPTPRQINEGVKLTLRELADGFNGTYSEVNNFPFVYFYLSTAKLDKLEEVLRRYETIQYDRDELTGGGERIQVYGSGK